MFDKIFFDLVQLLSFVKGCIQSRNKEYFGTEKKVLSCENLKFFLRI